MIWQRLAQWILKYRLPILLIVTLLTLGMGYFALQAKMRYDLTSAIPENNPEYIKHQNFMKTFGEDGTMLVVGFDKENVFEPTFLRRFQTGSWH